MNFLLYDHHNGRKQIPVDSFDSVAAVISKASFTKRSQAVPKIRQSLLDALYKVGWSEEAKLGPSSSITITSVRSSTGLCFQTGNMARMYADLLKLQLLFYRGKITGAIFLLFSKSSAKMLGENLANYDRLTRELQIFQDIITVPALVFGLEVVES